MKRKSCRFEPSKKTLAKAARIERREHGLSMRQATSIARDHLCENPRYYSRGRRGFGDYLHSRAAKALGWSVKDTESMSLQSLREMVRTVDPELAKEITERIRSGSYIRGPVAADMSWLGPPSSWPISAKAKKRYGGVYSAAGFKWEKLRSPKAAVHGRFPGIPGRFLKFTDSRSVRIFHTAPGRNPRLVGEGQSREIAEIQAKRNLGIG